MNHNTIKKSACFLVVSVLIISVFFVFAGIASAEDTLFVSVEPPVITLLGPAVVHLNVDDSYADIFARARYFEWLGSTDCSTKNWCNGADMNENGLVDMVDYAIQFAKPSELGSTGCSAGTPSFWCNGEDFNRDGMVDMSDSALRDSFATASSTTTGAIAYDIVDGDLTGHIVVTGEPANPLAVGTYTIHYNVTNSASVPATEVTRTVNVTNQDQAAPTGLEGVAPTNSGPNGDGSITGTDTTMEYKAVGDPTYVTVIDTSITGLVAGDYDVRYTAKTGYNASPDAIVTVPPHDHGHRNNDNPDNNGNGGSVGGSISFGGGGFFGLVLGAATSTGTTTGEVLGSSTNDSCEPGFIFNVLDGTRCPTTGQVLGASTFKFTHFLRRGMVSDDVIELQDRLHTEGLFASTPSIRYFGPATFVAVKAYQKAHGLPATGFVGLLTIAELNK